MSVTIVRNALGALAVAGMLGVLMSGCATPREDVAPSGGAAPVSAPNPAPPPAADPAALRAVVAALLAEREQHRV